MAKRPALTEAQRATILEDIRETGGTLEGSVRKIAGRHDVSTATVRRIAKEAGLTDVWSRDNTQNATRARTADLAELRSLTSARFLEKANRLLDDMDQPALVYSFGGANNTYADHWLDKPTPTDLKHLMTAAAVALDKHIAIEKHDTKDDAGAAAVDLWLRHALGRDEPA